MKKTIPKFLATVATGLLAGAFLYGLLNLVPTFYEVPLDMHLTFRIQLMNHNSITMQLLMGISIVMPLWYAAVNSRLKRIVYWSVLSALLALTALLVTRFGNVPINMLMRSWSVNGVPDNWMTLLHRWDFYNLIRCLAAIGSFISFIAASHVSSLQQEESVV